MYHYIIRHDLDQDTDTYRQEYRCVAMSLLTAIDLHLSRHGPTGEQPGDEYIQFTVKQHKAPIICVTVSAYQDAQSGGPLLIIRIEA